MRKDFQPIRGKLGGKSGVVFSIDVVVTEAEHSSTHLFIYLFLFFIYFYLTPVFIICLSGTETGAPPFGMLPKNLPPRPGP